MSAAKAVKERVHGKLRASSDVFTAMLGLALLGMLGTIAFVCMQNYSMFGEIFKVVGP